jgi:hypothetical protein
MSVDRFRRDIFYSGSTPIDVGGSTGDTVIMRVGVPIRIQRWGLVGTEALDVGAGYEISLDYRPTPGSDTNRAQIGVMTGTTDIALPFVLMQEVGTAASSTTATDGSTVVTGGTTGYVVEAGAEIVFDVDNAADTTGQGVVFIEYEILSKDGNNANVTVKTS